LLLLIVHCFFFCTLAFSHAMNHPSTMTCSSSSGSSDEDVLQDHKPPNLQQKSGSDPVDFAGAGYVPPSACSSTTRSCRIP
jgi:hypothetical protein